MTWVAIAVGVGGAVVGGAASYAGSKKQANAAKQAGQLNMDMFNILNRQQQPFIQGGYGALGKLNTLLGLSPRPVMRSPNPGYMPTPGGGVQPIMQMGTQLGQPDVHLTDPGPNAPGNNIALNRILALRAAHGDTQAGRILGMQR